MAIESIAVRNSRFCELAIAKLPTRKSLLGLGSSGEITLCLRFDKGTKPDEVSWPDLGWFKLRRSPQSLFVRGNMAFTSDSWECSQSSVLYVVWLSSTNCVFSFTATICMISFAGEMPIVLVCQLLVWHLRHSPHLPGSSVPQQYRNARSTLNYVIHHYFLLHRRVQIHIMYDVGPKRCQMSGNHAISPSIVAWYCWSCKEEEISENRRVQEGTINLLYISFTRRSARRKRNMTFLSTTS